MLLRARVIFPLLSSFILPLSKAAQLPMNPPAHPELGLEQPLSSGEPTLYDLIMIDRRATIFGDYVRSLNDMTGLLGDRGALTTVLVPTNKAVLALARKPHQGPPPKTNETPGHIEISEEQQDQESDKNVRNWVSAHIIPKHPISLSSGEEFETMHEGTTIRFTEAQTANGDWEHYVLYPNVKIVNKIEAANGAIYLIEGTVSYY